jgi:hypothetical protein
MTAPHLSHPGPWLRPAPVPDAAPRWGHLDGLQIGLAPLPGPRGLIRVYTPYLGHDADRLLNFIAVEPIPVGATGRGYSELEHSDLDGIAGKRFWSFDTDRPDPAAAGVTAPGAPAAGVLDTVDGIERLTVRVAVERFDNGADVTVRARFRADRPHEVGLSAFLEPGSVDLDRCILSATMGNFARLRRLELRNEVVSPDRLWPDFAGEHFTDHAGFGLDRLTRNPDGDAVVSASPDEDDPTVADYPPGTAEHWKYLGIPARQSWRAARPDPALRVQVNGRRCYWRSRHPIPGGTAYENFELSEPFTDGRELFFAVEPR